MAVIIETTMGCLTVDLFVKERPITCNNFLKLCKMKYYNFCLFHSVQNNFIAQTGDPTGTGNGGESVFGMIHGENAKYYEAEAMPKIKHSRAGLVSMVNCGNNMLGSQFFFTLGEDLHSLDGEHCVFGEVAEGLEVLIQLNEVICDEEHHPFRDIRITHTVILEDPFDDPQNLTFPVSSPEPTKERLMNGRIAPDEEVDDTKGKSLEEVEEMVQKREAQARATILEIVGDIPDADIAPPENILFVCKLNPVTTDEDLEIIFGRFGTIKSCEVIRDKTTGDSLQYAFIEFEDKKACENAFFKMDNVLIDDRRIHVDFSQSVAKMRWRGKGKGVDYFPDAKPKDSQQRVSKDGDGKFDQKERKRRRSRSRSPVRHKWRNQDERNSEIWEKHQDRKDKDREVSGRSYKKVRDPIDGRSRNYEDKVKGHEFRGQRIHERNREGRDWNNDHGYKWDNRMRHDGREHHHNSRSHGSERQADAEIWKGRDRRNRNYEKNERRDGDMEEKRRSSKESSSKSDKRSEDAERLSVRNDKMAKDDSDGKNARSETSRYDERKSDSVSSSKQKKHQEKCNNDFESQKYGPDMSSENEERVGSRNKKKRFEEDKDRMVSAESSRRGNHSSRSDEYRSHHYRKSASDDQTSSRISGRDDVNKDRAVEQRNNVVIDSDGSGKYELSLSVKHGSKDGRDVSGLKKSSDKKASKHASGDGSRRSWSSEKIKKNRGSKSRKMMQKRKRYSSSSSCCSNSSCSCGSSCCSSSSDSDDSDCDSNSELSESCSSSSTSPDRKVKMKKRRNKKKLLLEMKINRGRRTGHKKRQRSSSESSSNSLGEQSKVKRKHRRRKMDDSSSSEQKVRSASHSRGRKIKKRRKKSQKRKNESSDSSSEESSSSSESYVQRKPCSTKRKKKLKKGVIKTKKVKTKRNKVMKHKGKKLNLMNSSKKKRKRNNSFSSESSDSSAESGSVSSREDHKHRKEFIVKGKGAEPLHSR